MGFTGARSSADAVYLGIVWITVCVIRNVFAGKCYRGVAQFGLERWFWEPEAEGSNPSIPTRVSDDNGTRVNIGVQLPESRQGIGRRSFPGGAGTILTVQAGG